MTRQFDAHGICRSFVFTVVVGVFGAGSPQKGRPAEAWGLAATLAAHMNGPQKPVDWATAQAL